MVRMDSHLLKNLTHGKIRGLTQLCMICIVKLSRTAHVHDNCLEWLGTLIYSKLRNGDKPPFKNRGSTPILRNFVGVQPRNIHTKFEANPCSGLREVEKLKKFTPTTTTTDTT